VCYTDHTSVSSLSPHTNCIASPTDKSPSSSNSSSSGGGGDGGNKRKEE